MWSGHNPSGHPGKRPQFGDQYLAGVVCSAKPALHLSIQAVLDGGLVNQLVRGGCAGLLDVTEEMMFWKTAAVEAGEREKT